MTIETEMTTLNADANTAVTACLW